MVFGNPLGGHGRINPGKAYSNLAHSEWNLCHRWTVMQIRVLSYIIVHIDIENLNRLLILSPLGYTLKYFLKCV